MCFISVDRVWVIETTDCVNRVSTTRAYNTVSFIAEISFSFFFVLRTIINKIKNAIMHSDSAFVVCVCVYDMRMFIM